MKVLFICRGNVARSQWAEALFNHYSKNYRAISAGTEVNHKEGQTLEKYMHVCETMALEGVVIGHYRRKQLTPQAIKSSDYVIALIEKIYCPGYLLQNSNVIYWDVPDPKGADYETHVRIKDSIKGLVRKLVRELEP